jgi:hypothetical protein
VAVAELLQHGANPNASDGQGNTALHYVAMSLADEKVFASLLEDKANPNVRNNDGKTPLDLVKEGLRTPVYHGRFTFQDSRGVFLHEASGEQKAFAEKLIVLLHQRGALDNLPNWDRIAVSGPAANYSVEIFRKGTNDWNHFTLLELLWRAYNANNIKSQLNFSDLSHVVVLRPDASGTKTKRIEINLLNATNSLDFAKDVPLEFGDLVEIPERGHTLAEQDAWIGDQMQKLVWYFQEQAGEVKLVVAGGQTIQVPFKNFIPTYGYLGNALKSSTAQNVLTSGSDLSRVKVTRRDLKTKKTNEWILDCGQLSPGNGYPYFNCPDLLLRDGDVIEVPEKR